MNDYELSDEEKNYQGTDAEKLIMSTLLSRMEDMVKPEEKIPVDNEEWDDELEEWVTVEPKDEDEEDDDWCELEALSVEKKYVFDVVLGCGGPGDWFTCECDEDGDINDITYHYAWSGHAERRLWGEREQIVKDWIERNGLNPFARY